MNDYEVTYILRPSLEETEIDERSNAIAEIIRAQGGQVVSVEKLGKKRLAYEIADAREGSYVAMQFNASPAAAKELERQLRLHEDVLRELLIRLDKQALAQMAIAKAAQPRLEEAEESAEALP
ncbi:MAG: 30S ribosomal protein S6 [Candidatus Tyrphobacter sp.]